MGLVDRMKENIKNSGSSKKEILYFAADSKHRIRFLEELDEGREFLFHSSFSDGINALCAEHYGKPCPLCGDESVKDQTNYVFNVYDYDSGMVKLLKFKATGLSPIPALIEMFEQYGTIMDRDYIIKKVGKGMGGSFVVTPGDKEKFKSKVTLFKEKTIIDTLKKAFPLPNSDSTNDDDDDEDEVVVKNKARKAKKEASLKDKLENLESSLLKKVALDLGITKKEIKNLDDDELIDLMFEDYEEDDIKDVYEDVVEGEDE